METIAEKEEARAKAILPQPVPPELDPAIAPRKPSDYFDEFFGLARDLLKEAGKDEPPNEVLKTLDLKHYQRVISEQMSPEQKWPYVAAYAAMAYALQQDGRRIAAAKSIIDFEAAQEKEAEVVVKEKTVTKKLVQ